MVTTHRQEQVKQYNNKSSQTANTLSKIELKIKQIIWNPGLVTQSFSLRLRDKLKSVCRHVGGYKKTSRTWLLLNKLSQVLLNFYQLKKLSEERSKLKKAFVYFNSLASSLYPAVTSMTASRTPTNSTCWSANNIFFLSERSSQCHVYIRRYLVPISQKQVYVFETFNQCKKSYQHSDTSGSGLLR